MSKTLFLKKINK